jgi:molybdopterin synthase sulfur carrier subunit
MPVVHIPASLRQLTGGRDRFDVAGETLRQVFASLEAQCPGISARLFEGDTLRSDIAVAIDGTIHEEGGLTQRVAPDAEIYLVPPIGGG